TLDRNRELAARLEGALGLVAASTPDLERRVDDLPAADGVPFLRRGGLEPDVVAAAIRHRARELRDRIHGEGRRGHVGDAMRDGLVLPDRDAPLLALVRPAAADLQTLFRHPGARGRQRQTPGVERDERDLEALALLADQVLARHADVLEADDAVRERLEAHEAAAVLDLHTRRGGLHDEAADLLRLGIARHHDE